MIPSIDCAYNRDTPPPCLHQSLPAFYLFPTLLAGTDALLLEKNALPVVAEDLAVNVVDHLGH
jgi:hypothetical protein